AISLSLMLPRMRGSCPRSGLRGEWGRPPSSCAARATLPPQAGEDRMILAAIAFYALAAIAILSALAVISARNPVHSVLFLILTFFNAAGLFVLLGAEFLAMLLVVVYVGAVAVLFLFVVMMLDVDFTELKKGFVQYLPAGLLVAGALLFELILVAGAASSAGG